MVRASGIVLYILVGDLSDWKKERRRSNSHDLKNAFLKFVKI
jgi:hypothetical protein